jgi:hypothetical protein
MWQDISIALKMLETFELVIPFQDCFLGALMKSQITRRTVS